MENTKEQATTIADLYRHEIHGITFTLFERFLGAKIYRHGATEVRMNFGKDVKKIHLKLDQLRRFRNNVDFLYRVACEREQQLVEDNQYEPLEDEKEEKVDAIIDQPAF